MALMIVIYENFIVVIVILRYKFVSGYSITALNLLFL